MYTGTIRYDNGETSSVSIPNEFIEELQEYATDGFDLVWEETGSVCRDLLTRVINRHKVEIRRAGRNRGAQQKL